MTDIKSIFEKAVVASKSIPTRPDNDTMLNLYALFKQASSGDVSGDKPGFFDFVATAKYEAWEQIKGLSSDDAKQQYVDLVKNLGGKVDG